MVIKLFYLGTITMEDCEFLVLYGNNNYIWGL